MRKHFHSAIEAVSSWLGSGKCVQMCFHSDKVQIKSNYTTLACSLPAAPITDNSLCSMSWPLALVLLLAISKGPEGILASSIPWFTIGEMQVFILLMFIFQVMDPGI